MKIPGYHIKHQIGQGGMAMVYYAIQESLGRPVALKIMNPLLADRPEFSQRFLNEGRLLAALQHNHIITIYDIGVSEQYHYISMEYVDGGDLKQRILRGLSPLTALDYTITLGHCLKAAHDRHIVHRDLKPVNILFRHDDTLLLTDFGVAKHLETVKELTALGSMVGSPYYLSPEQALGRTIDGRADIYSLGIILYEMLVGVRPFQGDSAVEIAMKHVNEPPPPLSSSLSHFQPLLNKMTAKDPQDRFPNAASLVTAAQQLRDVGTSYALSTSPSSHASASAVAQHTARSLSSAERAAGRAEVSTTLANTALDTTVIERASLASTIIEASRTSSPPLTGQLPAVWTFTATKIWLGAGAVSLLALLGVFASGGLMRFTSPVALPTSLSSPPNTGAETTLTTPTSQAAPAGETMQAIASTPPTGTPPPEVLTQALPPAQVAQAEPQTDFPQDEEHLAPTDTEHPATVLPRPESSVAVATAPPVDPLPAVDPAPAVDVSPHAVQIEQWLAAAQDALAQDRLTSPATHSAVYFYEKVQELAPTDSRVAQGWVQIAERYYELAQEALNKKRRAKAQQYVDAGLRFQSDHAGLLALQEQVEPNGPRRDRPPAPAQHPSHTVQFKSGRSRPSSGRVERSTPGFFQGVKDLFRSSPSRASTPSGERAGGPE